MKVMAFYIDKKYFAEKLGIEESQLVIGDVTSSFDAIDFKVFIDNDAEIKNPEDSTDLENGLWNVRRQKIEDFGESE